ncbi:hypothetical protein TGAMA5MH_09817 [Trichoderma gamsii]|uniref:Uncharacterized protein n=1 Tax=Trichoderma gamsii TaxID=398673 RepID=A0A2K0SY93_9HYPO|nr:hypothetical protein TGAMA5MH_09817 [Trichoderma gamsii]
MAALPPQLCRNHQIPSAPRSKPKAAKSFVAAFRLFIPTSKDPSANPWMDISDDSHDSPLLDKHYAAI